MQAHNENELVRLKQPGAVQERLTEIDSRKPLRRIHVMGVGRSGTWLLTHIMATFFDVEVVPRGITRRVFRLADDGPFRSRA